MLHEEGGHPGDETIDRDAHDGLHDAADGHAPQKKPSVRPMRGAAAAGAGGTGGSGRDHAAASLSAARTIASASVFRPFKASQRGDSGMALRSQSTTNAPRPAMTNTGRQPNAGITSQLTRVEANSPKFVTNDSSAAQWTARRHRPTSPRRRSRG